MVGYMSLEEQVDRDFERARRRSLVAWIRARLRGDVAREGIMLFDESRRSARADNRVYLGRRVVEVSRIVGSVGRHREFDRDFMPTSASAERWKRVDRAFQSGVDLAPVSLYQIGGDYYVHDGNHRVSVAHYHGVEWIDAEVTRFRGQPNRDAGACGACDRTAA
ncbi:MAG TPA: hypothetical protein VFJ72_10540 [Rubrobacteraceae bacterium]|nr:hypothetical protein [Rubrobacteraceae bacterium]